MRYFAVIMSEKPRSDSSEQHVSSSSKPAVDDVSSDREQSLHSAGEYDLTLINTEDAEFLLAYPDKSRQRILRNVSLSPDPISSILEASC